MTNRIPLPPPGFDELPVADQVAYVQSLWDRIAANPGQIPLPAWHAEILDERLAEHQSHPEGAKPWDDVRTALRLKLDRGNAA
jgi:putative addiction module component (TIGR02574 family)